MATYSSRIEVEYVDYPLDRASALRSAFDMLSSIVDNLVAETIGVDHCFRVEPSALIADSRIVASNNDAVAVCAGEL